MLIYIISVFVALEIQLFNYICNRSNPTIMRSWGKLWETFLQAALNSKKWSLKDSQSNYKNIFETIHKNLIPKIQGAKEVIGGVTVINGFKSIVFGL